MENHIADILHSAGTIIAIVGFMWKMRKDISNEIDTKITALEARLDKRFETIDNRFDAMGKRFDAMDERLARIEQNHLEHIVTLHAIPSTPPATKIAKTEKAGNNEN